jgi:GntR family transcriptional repressor for pyruvate dehydrogenase complex
MIRSVAADVELTKIERGGSLSERVTDRIVAQILSGALKPGDKLPPEPEMCEKLGVGRTSLREGLRPLVLLGLIRVRPGEGTTVSENTSEFFAKPLSWGLLLGTQNVGQLIEARQMLELGTIVLAASRGSDEEVARLGELVEQMEAYADDARGRLEFDLAFHMQLATMSRNPVLGRLMLSMISLLRPWIEKVATFEPDRSHDTLPLHRRIFEAIQRRDPVGAQAAMSEHISIWESQVSRLMAMHPDSFRDLA